MLALANVAKTARQRGDVLAVYLDKLQIRPCRLVAQAEPAAHFCMRGLDEGRLAHTTGAPQQGVVGRQPPRETLGVVKQLPSDRLDALEKLERDAIDLPNGLERRWLSVPNESLGSIEVRRQFMRRSEALEGRGNAFKKCAVGGQGHFVLEGRGSNWRP